jgi:hypothetical protein
MRLAIPTAALALLALAVALSTPVRAEDTAGLRIEEAKLRRKVHPRTGAARDSFVLTATFPDQDALREFDPSTDPLTLTLGDLTIISTAAPDDAKAFRLRRKRGTTQRWSYRTKGADGDVGRRSFDVRVRKSKLKLVVKRAYLRDASLTDPDDVPVTVTVGDVTASTTISFDARSDFDWRYRRLPSGGTGPVGPVTWDQIATGSLADTPRPNIEVARSDTELAALWTRYGRSGTPPAVDFEADMVVTVSASIRGPGAFPPEVQIASVAGTGNALRVDWYLAGCDWNQCPGAPAPVTCPTATPFRMLRVTKADAVQAVQGPTLGVCP